MPRRLADQIAVGESRLAQPLREDARPSRTDPGHGLTDAEAASRRARFGPNELVAETRRGRWRHYVQPFTDPMVLLLAAAAAVFFLIGEQRDATVMLIAIVPVVLVDFVLEARAERTLDRLRALTAPRVRVRRDGREAMIASVDLVPGDLVILHEGDVVPADSLIVRGSAIQVDESVLTGESVPVAKTSVG